MLWSRHAVACLDQRYDFVKRDYPISKEIKKTQSRPDTHGKERWQYD